MLNRLIYIYLVNLISIQFNSYYRFQLTIDQIYLILDSVMIVHFDEDSIEYIKEWLFYILSSYNMSRSKYTSRESKSNTFLLGFRRNYQLKQCYNLFELIRKKLYVKIYS